MTEKNQDIARQEVADITTELAALQEMTVGELAKKYREVFGEPTHSRNKQYLKKKLAWKIQEIAKGGLSVRAKKRIDELAEKAPIRWKPPAKKRTAACARKIEQKAPEQKKKQRDPRLPPSGTVLQRKYKGSEYEVTVCDDDFEYEEERYGSLSKIAQHITGTAWNGFLFFGLTKRGAKRDAESQ